MVRSEWWSGGGIFATRHSPTLHEGTEPGDRFADDQVLHLERAFVGVERFAVGKKTSDLVVGDDAVAAQHLAGPGDRLATLRRAKRLGQRRMSVGQLAFVK